MICQNSDCNEVAPHVHENGFIKWSDSAVQSDKPEERPWWSRAEWTICPDDLVSPWDIERIVAEARRLERERITKVVTKLKAEDNKKYELAIHQIRRSDDENELQYMRTERIGVISTYDHVLQALSTKE